MTVKVPMHQWCAKLREARTSHAGPVRTVVDAAGTRRRVCPQTGQKLPTEDEMQHTVGPPPRAFASWDNPGARARPAGLRWWSARMTCGASSPGWARCRRRWRERVDDRAPDAPHPKAHLEDPRRVHEAVAPRDAEDARAHFGE